MLKERKLVIVVFDQLHSYFCHAALVYVKAFPLSSINSNCSHKDAISKSPS
jgi:hypothetical protein